MGDRDPRVTGVGYWLRKYKLDEFPQLWNVLNGTMSLVGPRPEVRKYIKHYSDEQLKVLSVTPGITDYASIEYAEEAKLLAGATDPEQLYIESILPRKLDLNLHYVQNSSFGMDLKILLTTFLRILRIR